MLPAAARDLFDVDPGDFVGARNALVRELTTAGDKDAAAAVKRLRRPSVPVWALNQVARRDHDAAAELIDAATGAADAQQAVLNGADASRLRDALTRRRDAIGHALSVARRAVDASGRSSDAYARELDDGLNTVAASPSLRDQFARGELTSLDAPDADIFDVPEQPSRREPSPRLAEARKHVEARQTVADAAADALARAEQALAHATRVAEEARERQIRAHEALARSAETLERLERAER